MRITCQLGLFLLLWVIYNLPDMGVVCSALIKFLVDKAHCHKLKIKLIFYKIASVCICVLEDNYKL